MAGTLGKGNKRDNRRTGMEVVLDFILASEWE
jgi:hypothetical protein